LNKTHIIDALSEDVGISKAQAKNEAGFKSGTELNEKLK